MNVSKTNLFLRLTCTIKFTYLNECPFLNNIMEPDLKKNQMNKQKLNNQFK